MNTACVSIMNMSSPYRLSFVAFFGRTFDEYMQMFATTPEELRTGRTLDCPSGPDSFIAEGLRQGLDVVGCDPMYQFDASEIHARGKASIDATFEELKKIRTHYTTKTCKSSRATNIWRLKRSPPTTR